MEKPPADREQLHRVLREQFGLEAFRPGQEEAIRSLLHGRDVLFVQPTGAGKSLVFQVASQFLPGVTLVVSPLIALMKDQTDSLTARGIDADVIHSGQTVSQAEDALERVDGGATRLLYITPERLENAEFREQMRERAVSLVVVDEAHCVSEWGYDFRPAYLALAAHIERLGRPPLLALTATAAPWVRRDIIERLRLRAPETIVRGVDRPNLFFEVRTVSEESDDFTELRALLNAREERYSPELGAELAALMQGNGIIYTATTRAAEETAQWLREWQIPAGCYHGQLKKSERDRVQEAFMSGELRVIAATNAFGLGIDKPDVRFVVHRDVPASLEAYYQEAGRAGRDGEPARCVLIYRAADLGRAAFLNGSSRVTEADLTRLRRALREGPTQRLDTLRESSGLSKPKVLRGLDLLAGEGLVEFGGDEARLLRDFDPHRISLDREERRKRYERSRLEMVRSYALLRDCRRRYLLNYFGEETEAPTCSRCDNDVSHAPGAVAASGTELAAGVRVRHPDWGEGAVVVTREESVEVEFATVGRRILALSVVRERGLLEVVGGEPVEATETPGEDAPWIDRLTVGAAVTHEIYGEGEVVRIAEECVVVLFAEAGYHTLAKDVVIERDLLHPAACADARTPR